VGVEPDAEEGEEAEVEEEEGEEEEVEEAATPRPFGMTWRSMTRKSRNLCSVFRSTDGPTKYMD